MAESLLVWLPENKILIAIISIILNVVISISGILPSAFLTAVNITIFDFKIGLILSIIGEAIGAIISFILYRKGLIKLSNRMQNKNKFLLKLQHTRGWEGVFLVLVLRTLPFVPSGVVTLFAAFSKMGIYSFSIASTLGKAPSLLIEAYAVDRALQLPGEWQIFILLSFILVCSFYFYKRKIKRL